MDNIDSLIFIFVNSCPRGSNYSCFTSRVLASLNTSDSK